MNRRTFFNHCAATWDTMERDNISERLERVIAEAHIEPDQTILDVGTGTGVLIPRLTEKIGEEGYLLGIDVSPEMLQVARARDFPDNVELREANIQESNLPDGKFDRVMCNATFPHFSDHTKALAEMIRVLKPGGLLVISHPIGRKAVNELHHIIADVVADDTVPSSTEMKGLLSKAGLTDVKVVDEPDFYLARGRKPE